ncbi:MAG: hypothetical protein ABIQ74_12365 [Chitinophagales bacterium]
MKILTELTPSETMLILKPAALVRDLMKYAMMDLLMQEKLSLINFEVKPVQGLARLGFAGVVAGKNFKKEEPKLHEMIFLFPFYRKPEKQIIFRHLLQMALSAAKNESNYKQKLLLDDQLMKPLFKKRLLQKIFGGMDLSAEGKKIQQAVIHQFNQYDKILPPMIKNDKQKAMEMLKDIKGNILLLNSFSFDLIPMISREIIRVEEELEDGPSEK